MKESLRPSGGSCSRRDAGVVSGFPVMREARCRQDSQSMRRANQLLRAV